MGVGLNSRGCGGKPPGAGVGVVTGVGAPGVPVGVGRQDRCRRARRGGRHGAGRGSRARHGAGRRSRARHRAGCRGRARHRAGCGSRARCGSGAELPRHGARDRVWHRCWRRERCRSRCAGRGGCQDWCRRARSGVPGQGQVWARGLARGREWEQGLARGRAWEERGQVWEWG